LITGLQMTIENVGGCFWEHSVHICCYSGVLESQKNISLTVM